MDTDRDTPPDGIRYLDGSPTRASPVAESLAGIRSLAEIEATSDKEARLVRLVSLLEVLVRGLVTDAGPERKSLNRLLETLSYSGAHPRHIAFRALEYAINVRNGVVHPNSGLRHTTPVDEREIRFALDVITTAVRELVEGLPPEVRPRVLGEESPRTC